MCDGIPAYRKLYLKCYCIPYVVNYILVDRFKGC